MRTTPGAAPAAVVFAYTESEARISQSLTIVREPSGDLFFTAKYAGVCASATLPESHKKRLLEWLTADIECPAAEAAASHGGRVVLTQGSFRAPFCILDGGGTVLEGQAEGLGHGNPNEVA